MQCNQGTDINSLTQRMWRKYPFPPTVWQYLYFPQRSEFFDSLSLPVKWKWIYDPCYVVKISLQFIQSYQTYLGTNTNGSKTKWGHIRSSAAWAVMLLCYWCSFSCKPKVYCLEQSWWTQYMEGSFHSVLCLTGRQAIGFSLGFPESSTMKLWNGSCLHHGMM